MYIYIYIRHALSVLVCMIVFSGYIPLVHGDITIINGIT